MLDSPQLSGGGPLACVNRLSGPLLFRCYSMCVAVKVGSPAEQEAREQVRELGGEALKPFRGPQGGPSLGRVRAVHAEGPISGFWAIGWPVLDFHLAIFRGNLGVCVMCLKNLDYWN